MNRPMLTRADYDRIRAERDARVRARLRTSEGVCAGCAANLDAETAGCLTCWERHRYRRRRLDPETRKADNARRLRDRRRQRARERGQAAA